MENYILSLLIFTPAIGCLLILLLPAEKSPVFKQITVVSTGIQLALSVYVFLGFQSQQPGYQWVEEFDWITMSLGKYGILSIDYYLGVDGISLLMVLLTGIVMFIGAISSWTIDKKHKGYHALYLLLSSNIMGCFLALDFFLFYLFFEFMLLPMYFLIGIWGGKNSAYASIKFFIYTLLGSLLILIVMIGLYLSTIDPVETAQQLPGRPSVEQVQQMNADDLIQKEHRVRTFSIPAMMQPENLIPGSVLAVEGTNMTNFRAWAFILIFLGFAIKLPIVPLHTWLPDAHVEAPTPISVVLAGILLKIGGYGFFRFAYGLFPEAAFQFGFWLALLGVIAIIYGGLNAMAQKDLKKLIAYSSVSHMGFVLLGLASLTEEGLFGSLMMMFSHGLTSAASFLIAGVIYDRTYDRLIDNYSGIASKMPYFTFFTVIVFFASLGLPGFSGFVAELLSFLGAFSSGTENQIIPLWLAIISLSGLLISAGYYLWVIQRMYFGEYWVKGQTADFELQDLGRRELLMFVPLAILIFLFGIAPFLAIDPIQSDVALFLEHIIRQGQQNATILISR